jgi:LPPG:FO 2-phospho-L-lactate transferase
MTRVLALSGGIGGAKLALGLQNVLAPGDLTVVVNTGDDFEYLGLAISPDIDTTLYTLAGLANPQLGWGRADETWNCMNEIERIDGAVWFRLGDKDLAVHLQRTRRLSTGESLQSVTSDFARLFGLKTRIVPMSNDPIRTMLTTDEGTLAFQEYFVNRQCKPVVRSIAYNGASAAQPAEKLVELIANEVDVVVVCPSNPYLSIDPILATPGLRAALRHTSAAVVAVSPLIAGHAIKGPTAKLMLELGVDVS